MRSFLLLAILSAGLPVACTQSTAPTSLVREQGGGTDAASPAYSAPSTGVCGTGQSAPHVVERAEARLANYRRAQASGPRSLPADVQLRAIESNEIRVYFNVIRRADSGLASDGDIPEVIIDHQLNALNNAMAGGRGGASTPFRFRKAGFNRVLRPDWFVMNLDSDTERAAKQTLRMGGPTALNVYVADLNSGACTKGYATFPWDYEFKRWQDGVVLDWSTVIGQSNGSLGMTLVHEVGHWLGLYHTHQDFCTALNDRVEDTASHPPLTCSQGACSFTPTVVCPSGAAYPRANYMNYHNDECMTEFTPGQATRMRDMYAIFREGAPDDLVAVGGSPGWSTIPVAISRHDNSGQFDALLPLARDFANWASDISVSKLIGDFNNDGRSDVALLGGSGWTTIPVAFFDRNAVVTTSNSTVADFPAWARETNATRLVGDFNRDGRDDLALLGASGRTTLPIAFSNGNGTFNVTNFPASSIPAWATQAGVSKLVGDFNGDGRSDVALTGAAGWTSLPVAYSKGTGTFDVFNTSVGEFGSWAAMPGVVPLVGDFDGDGRSDVALTGGSGWTTIPMALSRGGGIWWVVNNPVGENFGHHATAPAASKLVGDFNGDGLSDIALTGNGGWNSVAVATSRGTRFDARLHVLQEFAGWSAMANVRRLVGDFNNDGKADIALTGGAGWLTIPVAFSDGANGSFRVTNERADNFAVSAASSNSVKGVGSFRD